MLPQWQPPESKGITAALRPSRSSVLRNVGREIELILGDAQRHPVLLWDFVGLWRMAVNAEDTIAEDDVVCVVWFLKSAYKEPAWVASSAWLNCSATTAAASSG